MGRKSRTLTSLLKAAEESDNDSGLHTRCGTLDEVPQPEFKSSGRLLSEGTDEPRPRPQTT